jgi:hypothetical protein
MTRFCGDRIEVEAEGVPLRPVSFTWRGSTHRITSIEKEWHDWHVPVGGPKRIAWKNRRHRTYFRATTTQGKTVELYYDRKGKRAEWILYRELDSPVSS